MATRNGPTLKMQLKQVIFRETIVSMTTSDSQAHIDKIYIPPHNKQLNKSLQEVPVPNNNKEQSQTVGNIFVPWNIPGF